MTTPAASAGQARQLAQRRRIDEDEHRVADRLGHAVQRVAVVLAHGYGWTHREVAELLGISTSSVQKHVERAMAKLQAALEVTVDD